MSYDKSMKFLTDFLPLRPHLPLSSSFGYFFFVTATILIVKCFPFFFVSSLLGLETFFK